MKFLVDSLPYYGEDCPFREICLSYENLVKCPRHWDKYKVTSDENLHECKYLIEQTGESNG